MITEDALRQMGIYLMSLREKERALQAELEDVQLLIRRQEGAVQFAESLLKAKDAGKQDSPVG